MIIEYLLLWSIFQLFNCLIYYLILYKFKKGCNIFEHIFNLKFVFYL